MYWCTYYFDKTKWVLCETSYRFIDQHFEGTYLVEQGIQNTKPLTHNDIRKRRSRMFPFLQQRLDFCIKTSMNANISMYKRYSSSRQGTSNQTSNHIFSVFRRASSCGSVAAIAGYLSSSPCTMVNYMLCTIDFTHRRLPPSRASCSRTRNALPAS